MDRVSELNKRKVQLFIQLVLNEGRLELIDELIAEDYVGYLPCLDIAVLGRAGVRRLVSDHPDLQIKVEDQVAEDDRVATRWQATTEGGTPRYAGISMVRLLAGKQVDSHTECVELVPADQRSAARAALSPGTPCTAPPGNAAALPR
jgi:predicted SnoaL-like aldol condensation-catalyzing enzyme